MAWTALPTAEAGKAAPWQFETALTANYWARARMQQSDRGPGDAHWKAGVVVGSFDSAEGADGSEAEVAGVV